jgi:hypothetical protein
LALYSSWHARRNRKVIKISIYLGKKIKPGNFILRQNEVTFENGRHLKITLN